MSSDAARAMYPDLAKRERSASTRQQGATPKGISASECVYPSKREERRFWNPFKVPREAVKPATRSK